ncbi:MAG: hypothetical protein ABFS32_17270 [Bacteroidota bacterium]
MKLFATFSILLFIPLLSTESPQNGTETATHIFWEGERFLFPEDYEGEYPPTDPALNSFCEEYGMHTMGYFGLFSVLDIPKRKKFRSKLLEKVYFAPAFDKEMSFSREGDSLGILYQQLIFDIYELSARKARSLLNFKISQTDSTYGIQRYFYKTIEADVLELNKAAIDACMFDIYLGNVEHAYTSWRHQIDSMLNVFSDYKTTNEERLRFITNKPVDERYKKAESVVGPMQ